MTEVKKFTVVLGASTNPSRYSYLAVNKLVQYGHKVLPIGLREGMIAGAQIMTGQPMIEGIDTVTLYLNPERQQQYYKYILSLQPKRIIFNPGSENDELAKLAEENGIEATEACTLVLLSTGQY
ncbi:MAG: CoA-binding protein [Chitinophagaceae bacterium]|nr:CoA-binding protein [Chitinophagaceae bacterium]